MKSLFKKHLVLIIIFSVLIFITLILFIVALSLKDTTEVEIRIAPSSATVTIDGKEYQNGTFRISSGNHQVKIEKAGFEAKEFSFNTAETTKVYSYLIETDGSYNWYLNHQDDALLLTSIGDYESHLKSASYAKKYPISTILPIIYANYDEAYNYTEYRIDGGEFPGCNSDFCIKITDTTGGNYDAAIQKLKETNFNPGDYQIIYEYTPIEEL